MKILIQLFITFAKIGLFTFGGGYAMLPIITREISEKRKWATQEELLDFYAVAQCTPGIIAVNTATFIGAKQKGISGAASATLAVIFPSVIIITVIAIFLNQFSDNETLQNAFAGIRIAVCATITVSVFKLSAKAIDGFLTGIVAATAFILVTFVSISPVIIALSFGGTSVIYSVLKLKRGRKTK
jgi:chromate transporter